MATRNVYLKIETIPGYCPVEPDDHVSPPIVYRRDCMRNTGHEDGTIPPDEVNARRLTALIYREYLDFHFLVPKPDKIVAADINEPAYTRRVPGTVIYAKPGDLLRIHVKNADIVPHSFHVHGVRYGIDSDGSWPFGTQSDDGRRSDEICPGQTWTYTYEVTEEAIGAWPFHDHCRDIGTYIDRGLFGGLIVLPEKDHDGAKQVPPFAGDPHVGFIHVPSREFPLHFPLQSTVDFRTVGLSPAPNSRMIDREAPLRHKFFEIAQAETESAIPTNTSDDHVRLEFALPEQGRPAGLHCVTLPNPQPQHFPSNSWCMLAAERCASRKPLGMTP